MKKILSVILCAAMTLSLAACGSGSSSQGSASAGSSSASSNQESAAAGENATQAAPAAETVELKFSHAGSDTSTWQAGAEKFGELLSEYTNGKFSVTIYASDQLSNGNQAGGIELVQNGTTDIHLQDALVWSSVCQKAIISSFPWLLPTYEDVDKYMEGEAGEALKAALSESGVVCLALGENGYRQVVNTRNAINGLADLQGLKIRVPGSAVHVSLLKYVGADPLTMNQTEVYGSLQNGTIDACENTLDLLYTQKTLEVVDYLTFWNYSYDPLFLSVSEQLWGSLSDEEKEAFQKAADEAMAFQKQATREKVETLKGKIAEEYPELEVVDALSDEAIAELQAAVAPVYEEYKDTLGEDFFNLFGYEF